MLWLSRQITRFVDAPIGYEGAEVNIRPVNNPFFSRAADFKEKSMITNAQREFAQMLGRELVQLWLQREEQAEPDSNANHQTKKFQPQKPQEKIGRDRNKPRSE